MTNEQILEALGAIIVVGGTIPFLKFPWTKARLEGDFPDEKVKLADIIQEKTRLSELLAESEENYSYLEAENESLKNKLIYLEADLSQVRETIEQERREKLTISGQIAALEAEKSNLMGLTSEITQLTEKLAAAETEKATIKNQVTILEGDFTQLTEKLAASETEKATIKNQVTIQEGDFTQLTEKLAASETEKATIKNQVTIQEGDFTQLTEKLAASAMVEEVIILEEEPILVEQQEPLPTTESFGEELVVHPVEVSEPPAESVEEREARTPEILEPPAESVIIKEPETLEHSLQDKKIVILGTLSKLSRDEAKELVQKAGGQLLGSPSANTDFVVVGKAPGDKLKKAQKLGITILSEAQFIEMLAL